MFSIYPDAIINFQKEQKKQKKGLLVELLTYQDDVRSLEFILQSIYDLLVSIHNEDESEDSIDVGERIVNAPFKWIGDKTDLAELVWALSKSSRVINVSTGQATTQKELTRQIEILFGLTLDVTGLMKGRMNTYKATSDGNTFTKKLADIVLERAASS